MGSLRGNHKIQYDLKRDMKCAHLELLFERCWGSSVIFNLIQLLANIIRIFYS